MPHSTLRKASSYSQPCWVSVEVVALCLLACVHCREVLLSIMLHFYLALHWFYMPPPSSLPLVVRQATNSLVEGLEISLIATIYTLSEVHSSQVAQHTVVKLWTEVYCMQDSWLTVHKRCGTYNLSVQLCEDKKLGIWKSKKRKWNGNWKQKCRKCNLFAAG